MDSDRCRKLFQQLEQYTGVKCGAAPKPIQGWLGSLGLPLDLLELLKKEWIQANCGIGHDRLLSAESIYKDKATALLLQYKFLNIGSASDGDWMVIDFATDTCETGLIEHERWNPLVDTSGDPHDFFNPTEGGLAAFLAEGLHVSESLQRTHENAVSAAAKRPTLTFTSYYTFSEKCAIASIRIPNGFKQTTSPYSPCSIQLTPQGSEGGMVICLFDLLHQAVGHAKAGERGFRDFSDGKQTWRLAVPSPVGQSLDSFMALLILNEAAVAVYASSLYWSEVDLRTFLANIQLRDQ